jgi:hypothetical protein
MNSGHGECLDHQFDPGHDFESCLLYFSPVASDKEDLFEIEQ